MPRPRAILLTALTFLPALLCGLLWLRSLSTSFYADFDPGSFLFQLVSKDSTVEFHLSHGGGTLLGTPTYWYHDAEGWRLIYRWLHLNEYHRGPHEASSFARTSLGFYLRANTSAISLHLPYWFLTLLALFPPVHRLYRLHRRSQPPRAFPVQPTPASAPRTPPPTPAPPDV